MQYVDEVTEPNELNEVVSLFNESALPGTEVIRVFRVNNPVLSRRFEQTIAQLPEPNIKRKFHGSVDPLSIIANGFHLPLLQRGMFGPGVYFASDSDKSRHFAVTNHLLLCKVALGRSLVMGQADESLNRAVLQARGYNSVQAIPGGKGSGGVRREEFVIYDPDFAAPEYLIEFSTDAGFCIPKFPFNKSFPTQLCTTCLASVLVLCVFAWSLDGRFVQTWERWVQYYKWFWALFFTVIFPVACVWYRASLSPMARRRGFLKLNCVLGTVLIFAPLVAAVVCFVPVAHASLTISSLHNYLDAAARPSGVLYVLPNTTLRGPPLTAARFLCFKASEWGLQASAVRQTGRFCLAPIVHAGCPAAYALGPCHNKHTFVRRLAQVDGAWCGHVECPLKDHDAQVFALTTEAEFGQLRDFVGLLQGQDAAACTARNRTALVGCSGLPPLVDLGRPVKHFQRKLSDAEQHRMYWLFSHVAVSTVCLVITASWLLLRRGHNMRLRRKHLQQQEAAITAELSMMLSMVEDKPERG